MAGGKETPRQKMIGMMYLVLTALLALNVSKEIINAFVTQDNQMLVNNNNLVEGINGFLTKFSTLELDNNTKKTYKKWKPKIDKIVSISNEIDAFLVENLNLMMNESEQHENWFTKDEETQLISWKDLETIKNKDNYDIATRLFGGEKLSEGYKKGAGIRFKLIELRDSLVYEMANYTERRNVYSLSKDALINLESLTKELTDSAHPDKLKLISIYNTLSQPEKLKNHGIDQDWQLVKFDHQPIVGAIGVFTEFRNQVRMAEQKALELIYGKIGQPIMKINKIEPQVIANTRYMNLGDTIGVRVGIIAYDSTATYPIKYLLGSREVKSDNNRFVVKGSSVGTQSINGSLTLDLADGKKEFPWSFDYTVGKPIGTISLPEYNILYSNYKNVIEASISGFSSTDVRVSCPSCVSFTKSGDKYIAKVTNQKEVEIRVNAKGTVFVRKYKVLPKPRPIALFVNKSYGSVRKGVMVQGTKLMVKPPPSSPLQISYIATSFTMEIPTSRGILEFRSSSQYLTTNMVKALKSIKPGGKVYFTNVKYKEVGSSKIKPISGVNLKAI